MCADVEAQLICESMLADSPRLLREVLDMTTGGGAGAGDHKMIHM